MNWQTALRVAVLAALCAMTILGSLTARAYAGLQASERFAARLANYSVAERTLRFDLLNARAGLLRNYDPVNADLDRLRATLAMLASPAPTGEAVGILSRLVADNRRQERLVERFKSRNALLQNSMARFGASSTTAITPYAALSGRILNLTLDTSPATVDAARAALGDMPMPPAGSAEARLLAHAALIVEVLPELDGLLQAIEAMNAETHLARLHTLQAAEADALTATMHRLELALGVAACVLSVALFALWAAIRLRTRDLKAQASNERLSAAIAVPLIDSEDMRFDDRVRDAAQRLMLHLGARRLQLVIPGRAGFWSGTADDPDWLSPLVWAADADGVWKRDRVIGATGGFDGAFGRMLENSGIAQIVMLRTATPYPVTIGFEPAHRWGLNRRDHVAVAMSAIIAIAHGARREAMQAERERLERTLSRARRMETIGTMTSGIAHNFNNIIGVIGGFAEMGQDHSPRGSTARRNFDEIQDAVVRARDLVDDVLAFGRQGRAAKTSLNLYDLVNQTVHLLTASARGNDAFRLTSDDCRYPVSGAERDLQQALMNVARNAAQAGGGRPVTIAMTRVSLRQAEHKSHGRLDAGSYAVVSITDRGPGIVEAARRRLFEPFFSTKPGGTGLGLSTAWGIVQDHGGTIDVANVPPDGARFDIWLPEAAEPSCPAGGGERVLLLGDPETIEVDEELIAELGYEPVGLPLTAEPEVVASALREIDTVIVSTRRRDVSERIGGLAAVLTGKRLLICSDTQTGDIAPDLSWTSLDYPLDRRNVSDGIVAGSSIAA